MEHVRELWSSYLRWVAEHPQLATDVETTIKWVSYLATGFMRNSRRTLLWSELAHSFSDVLRFINDRAYEQAFNVANVVDDKRIETFLGFLETAEVLLEVGSSLFGGDVSRWVVISTVQVLKCTWRLIYLAKKKKLLMKPMMHPVNRKDFSNANDVLPRSGRSMRRLDETSPGARLWRTDDVSYYQPTKTTSTTLLDPHQLAGEIAFILQPVVHLASMGIFGIKSWVPWLTSLGCDLLSHGLHWNISKLTPAERIEMWRRRQSLIIYLLRSPLYDLYTKQLFVGLFLLAKPKIPFSKQISEILMAYVPHYRRIYAYLWSK